MEKNYIGGKNINIPPQNGEGRGSSKNPPLLKYQPIINNFLRKPPSKNPPKYEEGRGSSQNPPSLKNQPIKHHPPKPIEGEVVL